MLFSLQKRKWKSYDFLKPFSFSLATHIYLFKNSIKYKMEYFCHILVDAAKYSLFRLRVWNKLYHSVVAELLTIIFISQNETAKAHHFISINNVLTRCIHLIYQLKTLHLKHTIPRTPGRNIPTSFEIYWQGRSSIQTASTWEGLLCWTDSWESVSPITTNHFSCLFSTVCYPTCSHTLIICCSTPFFHLRSYNNLIQ